MSTEPISATVLSRTWLSPSMIRVVFGGEQLCRFRSSGIPDEFVWLTFPKADGTSGGRYYTVRKWNENICELTVDFVKHDVGIGTQWAQKAAVGDTIEVYLPRSRFNPPPHGNVILIADYSALPAMARIVEELQDRCLTAHLEIPASEDRLDLGTRDNLKVYWHETFGRPEKPTSLADIARKIIFIDQIAYVWIAGEAKAVAECRKHFRDTCGLNKDSITAVGYWVEGQARG